MFFVLFLIVLARVATLPGAGGGYEYLFVPRWEALADPKTWVYALGQAFFSLSLAGSGTLVYGSYLGRDVDVVTSARNVALFDTLAAIVAAAVVVPAVFAFGLDVSSARRSCSSRFRACSSRCRLAGCLPWCSSWRWCSRP